MVTSGEASLEKWSSEATLTHQWIEEDLLYIGTCQAFRLDSYCICCRAI